MARVRTIDFKGNLFDTAPTGRYVMLADLFGVTDVMREQLRDGEGLDPVKVTAMTAVLDTLDQNFKNWLRS